MPAPQFSRSTSTRAKLGAALVACVAQAACGSGDTSHPVGAVLDDFKPDASSLEASVPVSDGARKEVEAQADGGADSHAEARAEAAIEASSPADADASEPPLCASEGGPIHPDQPTAPTPTTGVCAATLHRTANTSMKQGATLQFVGLTPDGRTLAWFEAGTLNVADRANASAAWSPAFSVDGVTQGPDRPALSPDGLRIVVVKPDRHGFTELARPDRQQRFATNPSEAQFAAINGLGVMLGSNEWLGSPVLSKDDRTFFYLRGDATQVRHDAVYASTRAADVSWPIGAAVHAIELDAICGLYRRPTGLSSDLLTLFYYDEIMGGERATFRKSTTTAFAGSIDLGDAADAVPNTACDTVYFTAAGGGVSSASLSP
jgi:hypothetical protein